MRLEPTLKPDAVLLLASPSSRDAVLGALADRAGGLFPGVTPKALLQGMIEREARFPTGTPEGVAFPHVLLPQIDQTAVIPALLRPGVRWSLHNHPAQDLVFAMFGHSDTPWEHVRMLARLARIARGPGALERLRSAPDAQSLYQLLLAEDRSYG